MLDYWLGQTAQGGGPTRPETEEHAKSGLAFSRAYGVMGE